MEYGVRRSVGVVDASRMKRKEVLEKGKTLVSYD